MENIKKDWINEINREKESYANNQFLKLFKDCPIPEDEKLSNLALYIKRQDMSRIIFMYELYKKIINVHGVIMEFGVRWGQDIALFESFRGMLEPFNYNRKIIGFDTFTGFPSVTENDRPNDNKAGDFNVTENYEQYLDQLLQTHETVSPIEHITKYQLVKGDAVITCEEYLKKHPETIIAFAYFDFDIYEPTKKCLELCCDHFTKGSVIGFDELNLAKFPGETIALKEVLGVRNLRIERLPFSPCPSYIVLE